jgi:hypothetical protein
MHQQRTILRPIVNFVDCKQFVVDTIERVASTALSNLPLDLEGVMSHLKIVPSSFFGKQNCFDPSKNNTTQPQIHQNQLHTQYPSSSVPQGHPQTQLITQPNQMQYPTSNIQTQYPSTNTQTQYPSTTTQQYPTSNTQIQYPTSNTQTQYPSTNTQTQYPSTTSYPPTQYPSSSDNSSMTGYPPTQYPSPTSGYPPTQYPTSMDPCTQPTSGYLQGSKKKIFKK